MDTVCLLHAFQLCLHEHGIDVGYNKICETGLEEIHVNWRSNKQFHSEECVLFKDVNEYIRDKKYNTNSGDPDLNMLCNYYRVTATVYRDQGGTITDAVQESRHSNVVSGNFSLALTGHGAGAHYSAVLPIVSSKNVENTPCTKELEDILPLPKARTLKKATRGKKRTTAILTDTPEKKAI